MIQGLGSGFRARASGFLVEGVLVRGYSSMCKVGLSSDNITVHFDPTTTRYGTYNNTYPTFNPTTLSPKIVGTFPPGLHLASPRHPITTGCLAGRKGTVSRSVFSKQGSVGTPGMHGEYPGLQ